jgi:hypothetical protein
MYGRESGPTIQPPSRHRPAPVRLAVRAVVVDQQSSAWFGACG